MSNKSKIIQIRVSEEEYNDLIEREPSAKKYIKIPKRSVGARSRKSQKMLTRFIYMRRNTLWEVWKTVLPNTRHSTMTR